MNHICIRMVIISVIYTLYSIYVTTWYLQLGINTDVDHYN